MSYHHPFPFCFFGSRGVFFSLLFKLNKGFTHSSCFALCTVHCTSSSIIFSSVRGFHKSFRGSLCSHSIIFVIQFGGKADSASEIEKVLIFMREK
ncbi:unnamed protein product [Lathyrus oleraceus]